MSVTLTVTEKTYPIKGTNRILYTMGLTGAGDGTGGTVNKTGSLTGIQAGDNVFVLNVRAVQNNAVTDKFSTILMGSQWTALSDGYGVALLMASAAAAAEWIEDVGSTNFQLRSSVYPTKLPIWLGNPIPSVATGLNYNVTFSPNTNAKSYAASLSFLIVRG